MHQLKKYEEVQVKRESFILQIFSNLTSVFFKMIGGISCQECNYALLKQPRINQVTLKHWNFHWSIRHLSFLLDPEFGKDMQ